MKNKYKIGFSVIALLSLTVVFNQCVFETKTNKVPKRNVASEKNTYHSPQEDHDYGREVFEPTDDPYEEEPMAPPMVPEVDPNQVREVTPDYGVKNFEQIYYTMSTLTGVEPTNSRVVNVYDDVSSKLPNDNDIKTFSSANQVAIVKLAAEYCDVMLENNTLRTRVYPNFNFTQNPGQAFSAQSRAYLIQRTQDHFFGEGMVEGSESEFMRAELDSLITNVLEGSNLGSATTTRMVGKALCVTALSSIHTSIF